MCFHLWSQYFGIQGFFFWRKSMSKKQKGLYEIQNHQLSHMYCSCMIIVIYLIVSAYTFNSSPWLHIGQSAVKDSVNFQWNWSYNRSIIMSLFHFHLICFFTCNFRSVILYSFCTLGVLVSMFHLHLVFLTCIFQNLRLWLACCLLKIQDYDKFDL